MASRKKSGSRASSGKRKAPRRPKPPKPPLPEEDPKLSWVLSTSAGASGEIAGAYDAAEAELAELISEQRARKKRKMFRRFVALGLGLIGLGVALYFLLQYLIR